jgi:uncharacterized protein YndB with AHSA1/START domain
MRFTHEMEYDAPIADVQAMLADPDFRERVCEAANTVRHEVTITPNGAGMSVAVDQVQPADGIPSFAKKIVGDEIEVLQREEWSDPAAATLEVSIPGKPGHLKGTITLTEDGERTLEVVDAEVKVHIPMLGGKLEKLIADLLASALRSEHKVGRAWLAGDR